MIRLEMTTLRMKFDHLIYKYKTGGRSQKDFESYQNLRELFKNLRDSNVNPREFLKDKNQILAK